MFEIGEYVVCGVKGVCQIRDITHIDMSGADKEKLYYVLAPVGDKNGTIYVPTDSEKIIMRRTISKELVGGLDVRHFFEQVHQLWEVEKLAESRSCPVAGSLRCQLQCCDGLPKSGSPAVEVGHVQFLQAFILKITLHGVKLGHGVADRCAGGKNHATVSGDLIHIAALGKHIGGFLRVRCG